MLNLDQVREVRRVVANFIDNGGPTSHDQHEILCDAIVELSLQEMRIEQENECLYEPTKQQDPTELMMRPTAREIMENAKINK